jgi:hypothetical protein
MLILIYLGFPFLNKLFRTNNISIIWLSRVKLLIKLLSRCQMMRQSRCLGNNIAVCGLRHQMK